MDTKELMSPFLDVKNNFCNICCSNIMESYILYLGRPGYQLHKQIIMSYIKKVVRFRGKILRNKS